MWILRERERERERDRDRESCGCWCFLSGGVIVFWSRVVVLLLLLPLQLSTVSLWAVFIVGMMILERDWRYQIFFVNCEIRKKVRRFFFWELG